MGVTCRFLRSETVAEGTVVHSNADVTGPEWRCNSTGNKIQVTRVRLDLPGRQLPKAYYFWGIISLSLLFTPPPPPKEVSSSFGSDLRTAWKTLACVKAEYCKH